MSKRYTRINALFLIFIMLFSLLPWSALANEDGLGIVDSTVTDEVYGRGLLVAEEVYKSDLQITMQIVTGDNASNFHQEKDRWNGKEISTDGFWADLQSVLETAQGVTEDSAATQEAVEEALAALQAVIDNLIPVANVNATALYEKVGEARELSHELYTEESWQALEEALELAEAMLETLYDEQGDPTEINVASYQETVDAQAAALTEAMEALEMVMMLRMMTSGWDGTSISQPETREIEGKNYYQIANGAQLAWFRNQVNSGIGTAYNAVLINNINLGGHQWGPIGDNPNKYVGTFDGGNFLIDGLCIGTSSSYRTEGYNGLFGYLGTGGVIKNLVINSGTIYGASWTGAVVGRSDTGSSILNCSNKVDVSSTANFVGGIGGLLRGTVETCTNSGAVSTSSNSVNVSVGGIVGANNSGTINNCYNTGSVTAISGANRVGGIVGSIGDSVSNSYNIGEVPSGTGRAGIVGHGGTSIKITNSYYLDTTLPDDNATPKTAAEMGEASFVMLLNGAGDVFIQDHTNINNGYPIFPYQLTSGEGGSGGSTETPVPEITSDVQAGPHHLTIHGEGVTLSVTAIATEGELTYQWYGSKDNTTYAPIEGATNSSYTVPTITSGTQYYRVIITNTLEPFDPVTVSSRTATVYISGEKRDLQAQIARVTGDNEDRWYHSDDRWNGKDSSTTGFWATLTTSGGPLTVAEAVYSNTAATQEQVDLASAGLEAAVAKLIPKTQVNATALYEAIAWYESRRSENQNEPISEDNPNTFKFWLGEYTEFTADNYRAALVSAKAMLADLYDADGNPREFNIAPNQGAVDTPVANLNDAANNLLFKTDYNTTQTYYESILALDHLFSMTENGGRYTADSWNGFTVARDTARAYSLANPIGGNIIRTQAIGYKPLLEDYWLACYNLKSIGNASVSVRVSDTVGTADPAIALEDFSLTTFNQTVILNAGTGYTLKALLDEAGITLPPEEDDSFRPQWIVYVNGTLLKMPVFHDGETRLSVHLKDVDREVDWNDVLLKDGDQVLLVRVKQPTDNYYIHTIFAAFKNLTSNFGQLRFTDPADKTAKEGQALPFTVERTLSYLIHQDGLYTPRSGAELVAYGPQNSDGSWPARPVKTGFVTDASGKASLALNQAGNYLVTAVDVRPDNMNEYFYPGLQTAAAQVAVTIMPLSASELAAVRAQGLADLDQIMSGYNQDILGDKWNDGLTTYENAKTAMSNTASLSQIVDVLDVFASSLTSLRTEAEKDFELGWLDYNLDYLPTLEELAAGKLTQDDGHWMLDMITMYQKATPYQRSQLTVAQKNHYDALVAAWDGGKADLPQSISYNVTVRYVPETLKVRFRSQSIRSYFQSDNNRMINLEETMSFTYNPSIETFNLVAMTKRTDNNQYELTRVVAQGESYYRETVPSTNTVGPWITGNPREDLTITFYGYDLTAEPTLEQARYYAEDELKAVYAGYNKGNYSNDNWAILTEAYNDGLAAIRATADTAAVEGAKNSVLNAMAAVPTFEQQPPGTPGTPSVGSYGSVRVTIENKTFYGGAFTGVFVDEKIGLERETTMMTAVLAALEKNDYGWTGTGGSSRENAMDIAYLAGITKEGKSLTEFDGGPQSGWMGTLNDWFTNEGFQSFRVSASNKNYRLVNGDQIAIQYTSKGYGADLGGTWGNSDTSLVNLNFSGGSLAPAFEKDTLNYILELGSSKTVSFTPTAANKNYMVRTYLNTQSGDNWYRRGENIQVRAGDVVCIGVGVRSWPSMNNQGAEAIPYSGTWYTFTITDKSDANGVITLIDNLPVVNYSNYKAQAEQVALARKAYDGLTSSAKTQVTNLAKLESREKAVQFFKDIDNVKALLAAIPAASDLKTSDRSKVQAAYDAYENLSSEQRLYITVGDAAKYNAAIEWLEKQGVSTPGRITGSTKMPASNTVLELKVTVSEGKVLVTISASDLLSALDDAKKAASDAIIIAPEITGKANKVTVELPKDALDSIAADSDVALTVETPVGNVTIPNSALVSIASQANGSNVTINVELLENLTTLSQGQRDAVGDNPVFDISLYSGSTKISTFGGESITISLPYTLKEGEEPSKVAVWHLNDVGELKGVPCNYDKETELATFTTIHLSYYVAGYDDSKSSSIDFSDVNEKDWFYNAVVFAVEEDLFRGTSATTFSPDTPMTRAMLISVLHRLAGSPDVPYTGGFRDVTDMSWYVRPISWSVANGIALGYGNDLFGPNDHLTREQLVAMLYRYATKKGYDTSAVGDLTVFTDSGQTSALEAMGWAVGADLISGKGNGILDPTGNASRAEVAAILQRFVQTFVK